MATAPRTAKIDSSLTVTWPSSSNTLDGWMVIGIVPPSVTGTAGLGTIDAPYVAYGNQIVLEKLPTFYVIPIIKGKFDQNCRVFYTSDLEPAGVTYVAWVYDRTWRLIDAPTISDAFTVTTDPFTPTYSLFGAGAVPGSTIPTVNS